MFVDASALLAILFAEPDAESYSRAMKSADSLFISPVAIYEVICAIMRQRKIPLRAARDSVELAIRKAEIRIVPITDEIGVLAAAAFEKYGKGRGHKAQLNMGDCFAYACAKSLGVPLLYKGDDFAKTDLA